MTKAYDSNDKLFLNVFPTLVLEEKMRNLFQEVEVTKIAMNEEQSFLHVYILSNHLIDKEVMLLMEKKIKEQLFPYEKIKIEIHDKYQLSPQYNVANVLFLYWDSILLELSQHNLIASKVFASANLIDEEGALVVELPKSVLSAEMEAMVHSLLMDRIENRFQLKGDVIFRHVKKEEKTSTIESGQVMERETESSYHNGSARRIQLAEEIPLAEEARLAEETLIAEAQLAEETLAAEARLAEETLVAEAQTKVEKTTAIEKPTKKSAKLKSSYPVKRKILSFDSNLIFGKNFEDDPVPLKNVISEMGEITVRGQVIKLETKEIPGDKSIVTATVTDFTDSIVVKMFISNQQLPDLFTELKKGCFVKLKGVTSIDKFDSELILGAISGIKVIPDFTSKRMDERQRKRVELHCHTKMSDSDGVAEVSELIRQAHQWGHQAIAITDHGVVQGFPEANNAIKKLGDEDPFKVIYGVEGYVVDDLVDIAKGATKQTLDDSYVVFDLETTGLSPIKDKIIEIGALKVKAGEVVDHFSTFVNPQRPIPYEVTRITKITDEMVMDSPPIEEVLPPFLEFIEDSVLVAHNANFDVRFLEQNCRYQNLEREFVSVDTLALARVLLPALSKYKLNNITGALKIPLENHHRAVDDAGATAKIFLKFIEMLKERGITTLKGINHFGHVNPDGIRKLPTYHIIILAKNDKGRFNLYKLISESHIHYYGRRPRIPKSLLMKYREGLIIGGACESGEIFQGILRERADEEMAHLAEFYDYYEIQPLGNNHFMIEDSRFPQIRSEEDLIRINKEIVKLGERFNKPVVATGDVHFLEEEDALYREIIMTGKGFKDAGNQPPLYLRTTQEMLDEFSYLGFDKAIEVVIDNTVLIADMVEKISPISSQKCVPIIEDSDLELREICYRRAHEVYGEILPKPVEERLKRELDSIISNGYAVMYIIAQKLVSRSMEDGYLVGSRGSVGSSFAATMAGFTEVNPLSPHYYCSQCYYSDFDSEEVRQFAGGCGFDMPDKSCPVCGIKLKKDGFEIPFECFLGFEGDKEPDIDLNFSGDYQAKAHRYTEELFGEGYTYRAGTIGTIAEKTAFGLVSGYYEDKKNRKRKCEIERIMEGCIGVRRSTGQHPGGIIVLPEGHDIHEFTPVQRAANDVKSNIITTHFAYESLEHSLFKLDILGHDDPTMIKALEEYINSDALDNEYSEDNPFVATQIPLDDKDVLSLFSDTTALGVKPEEILGRRLGCLGIPEFGTEFVIDMVSEAKPKSLSDLIRISGLSHGTNVWLNNAQDLIKAGDATISTCICTRDDIMVYLINQGMEEALAFNIMERVRRGQGLLPEWEEQMREVGVPDWYIWSCKRITYMFPKAHAAAYVMMAYRIAYCKIHYPLAYYAGYFGIRAKAFDYEKMCHGQERVIYHINEVRDKINEHKGRKKALTQKELDSYEDLKLVQEMYARGFEFAPIDIYQAKADRFLIVEGKLMPSLITIEGLGEKAAQKVEEESKKGKYLSLDDFKQRTKVNTTVVELMEELELFGNLPKCNQLSLFDL